MTVRTRIGGETKRILALLGLPVIGGAILVVAGSEDGRYSLSFLGSDTVFAITNCLKIISNATNALLTGAFGNPADFATALQSPSWDAWQTAIRPLSETLMTAAPLGIAGIGVSLAFRTGLFNIGGEGQAIVGGIAAGYVGFKLDLGFPLLVILCLAASFVAGGLWGGVAGVVKAKAGMHEVVTTILMNYVALNLAIFVLNLSSMKRPGRSDLITPPINDGARLPHLLGDGLRLHAGVLLLVVIAIGASLLLSRTALGLKVQAVGSSPRASFVNGIDSKTTWILALVLSGGLVGVAAGVSVTGVQYSVFPGAAATLGLDALVVALVANSRPVPCLAAALLVAALRTGGLQLAGETGLPSQIVLVIQSLVLFAFVAPRAVQALLRIKSAPIRERQLTGGWA